MTLKPLPENPVQNEHNEEEFLKDLTKLINGHELDSSLGVPDHILAIVMWNAIVQFTDAMNELHDYYDAVNEQLLQEQTEGD